MRGSYLLLGAHRYHCGCKGAMGIRDEERLPTPHFSLPHPQLQNGDHMEWQHCQISQKGVWHSLCVSSRGHQGPG